MTNQPITQEEALRMAEDLVQRLEVAGRRLVARVAELAEDVWVEARSVRDAESAK